MKSVTLKVWIKQHSICAAARELGKGRSSVYHMLEAERNIHVTKRDGKWKFIETKELN